MSEFSASYQPECWQHTFQTVTCSLGACHLHTELYILLELWPATFRSQLNANQVPQICLDCFCISLGKQVIFSGQCENKENTLQPQDYHCVFFLFSGNPCLCVALHWAPLSGPVENWKTEKQKPPIATAEPTPSSVTSQRLIQLLLSWPIKLFIFSSAVPKTKRTHRLWQHKCNVGH